MFKLCTNKNHSSKHNEQINNQNIDIINIQNIDIINKQNIDNSKCLGVKFVKIFPEMTSQ